MIDIVKLKNEIQKGNLEVFTKKEIVSKNGIYICDETEIAIYIRDTQNGECVKIGRMKGAINEVN